MKKIFLLSLLLLSSTSAFAANDSCDDLYEKVGAFEFQRFQGQMNCQVLASPAFAGTDYYRAAVVTDEGMFMVFNSYEYQKGTDGARVFYFFPRTRMPTLEKKSDGQMVVQTATSGISLAFDKTERRFAGMLGGVLTEDAKVHPNNKGGVELSHVKTLWLDSGFKFKGDPTADASRTSVFTDVAGKKCEIPNKDIFTFTSDGDSFFKFTDSELKAFINFRCPRLQVNW